MKRYPMDHHPPKHTSSGQMPRNVKLAPFFQIGVCGACFAAISLFSIIHAAAPFTSGALVSGSSASGISATHHQNAGFVTEQAKVDLIELNHFVDKDGREVFQQTVFYDWSKMDSRFHVRAWRLVKRDSQLPQRRWNPNHFICVWQDKAQRRMVIAPQMRETWTQQDPERVNRQFLSEDQRKPLFDSEK